MNTNKPFFIRSDFLPVEARSAIDSTSCYGKHSHEEFSIGIIESGKSEFYHSGHSEMIDQGSVVIINPNEVHSCNPVAGSSWSYKMLYLDTQWLTGLQQEIMGNECNRREPITFTSHIKCPKIYGQFQAAFGVIIENADQLEQEEALIDLLSSLMLVNRPSSPIENSQHKGLLQARNFIQEHCATPLKLADIAQAAGMSRYYLIHSFRKQYGITPYAYQLAQRVNKAKLLLRSGMDISTAALKAGFCDQSHLHRNFKKMVAATPKQYKDCF